MKKFGQLLNKIALFVSFADMSDVSIDPRIESEKNRLRQEERLHYEENQIYYDEHPEELEKYLDKRKEVFNKWNDKLKQENPEKYLQRRKKDVKQQIERNKNLRKEGTLFSLAIILGQQVNTRKSEIIKKLRAQIKNTPNLSEQLLNDLIVKENFLPDHQQLLSLREKLIQITNGLPNPTIEIHNTIQFVDTLIIKMKEKYKISDISKLQVIPIVNILNNIKNKLNETLDLYTVRGKQ